MSVGPASPLFPWSITVVEPATGRKSTPAGFMKNGVAPLLLICRLLRRVEPVAAVWLNPIRPAMAAVRLLLASTFVRDVLSEKKISWTVKAFPGETRVG